MGDIETGTQRGMDSKTRGHTKPWTHGDVNTDMIPARERHGEAKDKDVSESRHSKAKTESESSLSESETESESPT